MEVPSSDPVARYRRSIGWVASAVSGRAGCSKWRSRRFRQIDPAASTARDRLFAHPLAQSAGLLDLWQQAGLDDVELGSLTIRMEYGDFEDYWDPLLAGQGPVGAYVKGLEPALRERVKERVRAAYCSGSSDGPRSMTATAWAVRGIVP